MPRSDRGNTTVKARAHEIAEADGIPYTEALAIITDPSNEVICDTCGWIGGMACPECSGCGCDTHCTGWRHAEYTEEEDEEDDYEVDCEECGGSFSALTGYGCACRGD